MLPLSFSKSLKATVVAAALTSLCASATLAQTVASGVPPRAGSTVQLSSGVTFNWLAKKVSKHGKFSNAVLVSSENAPVVKTNRYFGMGSYICSPAGFGNKSRCFAR